LIDIVNLTQHYGIRPILRNVNMHVERGELVALMGPNGTGKTTLINVMAGVLPPTWGSISIDGLVRRSSEDAEIAIRKKVAYLPADAWLPSFRTGREWLLAVGRVYGHDDRKLMDHADRLIRLFDLREKEDSTIGSYSSGQKRKLALAAALISEAPVMLLDEPFSGGLDPAGTMALKSVFQHLRDDRQTTIVMSTPVPELIEDLADRVAVVREGELAAFQTIAGLRQQSGTSGRLDEVYAKLFSPQTAQNIERYFKDQVK